eukprot:15356235-Ditylum_brightwellii.AAC.1
MVRIFEKSAGQKRMGHIFCQDLFSSGFAMVTLPLTVVMQQGRAYAAVNSPRRFSAYTMKCEEQLTLRAEKSACGAKCRFANSAVALLWCVTKWHFRRMH